MHCTPDSESFHNEIVACIIESPEQIATLTKWLPEFVQFCFCTEHSVLSRDSKHNSSQKSVTQTSCSLSWTYIIESQTTEPQSCFTDRAFKRTNNELLHSLYTISACQKNNYAYAWTVFGSNFQSIPTSESNGLNHCSTKHHLSSISFSRSGLLTCSAHFTVL